MERSYASRQGMYSVFRPLMHLFVEPLFLDLSDFFMPSHDGACNEKLFFYTLVYKLITNVLFVSVIRNDQTLV